MWRASAPSPTPRRAPNASAPSRSLSADDGSSSPAAASSSPRTSSGPCSPTRSSREGLIDYQAYRQECEGTADRINARFGTADWTPVWFDTDDDLPRSIAGLRRYDVLVVNPIRDGLNLVAFEGPLVNERNGTVVLSSEAGAAEQLGDIADTVNPFDIEETALAMARGLDAEPADRSHRSRALTSIATSRTIEDWYRAQLAVIE